MKSGFAQIVGITLTNKKGGAQETNSESAAFQFN